MFSRGSVGFLFLFFTRSMNEDVHNVKKGKCIREYFWRIMNFLLKMRLVVLVVDSLILAYIY